MLAIMTPTPIEKFDHAWKWVSAGNLPEIKDPLDASVLGNSVYVVSGKNGNAFFSGGPICFPIATFIRKPAPLQPVASVNTPVSGSSRTAENNASATFLVSATDQDANTTLIYSKSGPADKFWAMHQAECSALPVRPWRIQRKHRRRQR